MEVLSTEKAVNFSENLLGTRTVKEGWHLADCEDKIRIFVQKTLLRRIFCLGLGLLQIGLPVVISRRMCADNETKK
jgi:hypothetical protein